MKDSKIINIQEYTKNKQSYNVGIVMGVLREELESGNISIDSILGLLSANSRLIVSEETAGGIL